MTSAQQERNALPEGRDQEARGADQGHRQPACRDRCAEGAPEGGRRPADRPQRPGAPAQRTGQADARRRLLHRRSSRTARRCAVTGMAQTNERVSEFLRNTLYNSPWLEKPELVEIKAGERADGQRASRSACSTSRCASSIKRTAGARPRSRPPAPAVPPAAVKALLRPQHGNPDQTIRIRPRSLVRRGCIAVPRPRIRTSPANGRCCPSWHPGCVAGAVVVMLGWFAAAVGQGQTNSRPSATRSRRSRQDYRGKLAQAVNLPELRKQKQQVEEYVTQLEKQLPGKAEMDALLSDINQAGHRPRPAVRAVPPGPGGGQGLLRRAADRDPCQRALPRHRRLRRRRGQPVAHRHAAQPDDRRRAARRRRQPGDGCHRTHLPLPRLQRGRMRRRSRQRGRRNESPD